MATDCRTCVKYDIIEDHALGRKGSIGEKVGHLTCFDTKTCPICGEFDRLPYACITIKSTDDQIPHLFLNF